nr:hypothetical protein [uncultured Flavobacterium sp.]
MNIETFEDLLEFIKTNDVSINDISKLVKETIDLRVMFYDDKVELINDLELYWRQWNHTSERPLFLDSEIPFKINEFLKKRLK